MSDPGPTPRQGRLQLGLALLLAGVLAVVVLLVNWAGSPEARIDRRQFQRLLGDRLVERVVVAADGLRCRLVRPIRVVEDGRLVVARQVLVADAGATSDQAEGWQAAGAVVEFEPQQGERGVPWVGLAVVLGLLGLGIAYLWSQASKYRRTGSPRQRLAEAEQALKEGRITPQEFQERCESIMAEM